MFCRYCGKVIPDEAVFCHLCGKDQHIASSSNDTQPSQTQDAQPAQPVAQPTAQSQQVNVPPTPQPQPQPTNVPPTPQPQPQPTNVPPTPQPQPTNVPPTQQRPSARTDDPSQYPVLHNVGIGAGRIRTSWIINIAAIVILSAIEFFCTQPLLSIRNAWAIVSFVALTIGINVLSISMLVNAIRFNIAAKSTNLNITEAGIYGVGCNKTCKVRKNINFNYSQFTRAYSQNDNMLFIEAGGETYCFPIDKASYYADIIKELQKAYNA